MTEELKAEYPCWCGVKKCRGTLLSTSSVKPGKEKSGKKDKSMKDKSSKDKKKKHKH
jgi:hypothetical protein